MPTDYLPPPSPNTGWRCFTHLIPNQILYEVEVFPLSTFSNLTPKRLRAEGWTLNSTGSTEGRNTYPTRANERDRAEAKRCAQKTTPWLRQLRRACASPKQLAVRLKCSLSDKFHFPHADGWLFTALCEEEMMKNFSSSSLNSNNNQTPNHVRERNNIKYSLLSALPLRFSLRGYFFCMATLFLFCFASLFYQLNGGPPKILLDIRQYLGKNFSFSSAGLSASSKIVFLIEVALKVYTSCFG